MNPPYLAQGEILNLGGILNRPNRGKEIQGEETFKWYGVFIRVLKAASEVLREQGQERMPGEFDLDSDQFFDEQIL